jgi:transposase
MAADVGRFGRLGEVRACWCPQEIRPIIPKQQVREYIYAYAAVAPELGQMTALVLPYANTKMMNLFLKQVSEDFREYLIIMQVDKAAWHRSKGLKIPENIRLLTQSSYSPELMPVEHLWSDLRENYFHNRIFKSISQVADELYQGLVNLASNPERLRSITYFPHLRISFLNAT